MSIPKIIHYCWFGRGDMPKSAKKCIASWKRFCPGFEIVCHNDDNFDLNGNAYANEAYKAEKWAFVSDYARLKVIYEIGGIYLDTDVELIKPLEPLLETSAYMGFEHGDAVATGLGFAAEPGNKVVGEMLKDYENIHFLQPDGTFDLTPCPKRNTDTLKRLGMVIKNEKQIFMDMTFLPSDYLCPMNYYTGKTEITENTYSLHHYSASWTSKVSKRTTKIKRIIGTRLYDKLYGKFLHKVKWLEW